MGVSLARVSLAAAGNSLERARSAAASVSLRAVGGSLEKAVVVSSQSVDDARSAAVVSSHSAAVVSLQSAAGEYSLESARSSLRDGCLMCGGGG